MSLRREWPLLFSGATMGAFLAFGDVLLAQLTSPWRFALAVAWLFAGILLPAVAAVRGAVAGNPARSVPRGGTRRRRGGAARRAVRYAGSHAGHHGHRSDDD